MRHLRRIALGLVVLFALQAGGAAMAVASFGDCCPAMVEARPEGTLPPCRSLAPAVCCKEGAAHSASDPGREPAQGLSAGTARSAALPVVLVAASAKGAAPRDLRALRSIVLRL